MGVAEANYGGRVTDNQDRRLINEILRLHNNANLTAAINEGMMTLKCALMMMSSFGAATGGGDDDEDGGKVETPEQVYFRMSSEVSARLPEKSDIEVVMRSYPVLYEECLN